MRPAIMAVLNIILDYFWGKAWGIIGIFLATTVSRLATQVWFDPWLVYKHVFQKSSVRYFITYSVYAGITALSCLAAYFMSTLLTIPNTLADFGMKMLIACIIPNLIVWTIYHKTDEFQYVMGMVKS